MTAEAATAFAERLKTDEGLQAKLAAAASPEERLAIARQEGFDLSVEDVGAVKESLGVQELSDEDLERIAGGMGRDTVVSVGTATVVAGTAVAAASAAFI